MLAIELDEDPPLQGRPVVGAEGKEGYRGLTGCSLILLVISDIDRSDWRAESVQSLLDHFGLAAALANHGLSDDDQEEPPKPGCIEDLLRIDERFVGHHRHLDPSSV